MPPHGLAQGVVNGRELVARVAAGEPVGRQDLEPQQKGMHGWDGRTGDDQV